ncbi:MAG: 3-isopropylmalate dehydratase small subunit [Planctomycetia bacterium]
MEAFTVHTGVVAPLDRMNVDTDAIIPKQFLKRIERTGFGDVLFFEWRFDLAGKPIADFVLNRPPYDKATVLVARANFGCGSSREHAPWALNNFGFRALLAPSFADIFYNNCFKNGILPIVLSETQIDDVFRRVEANPGYTLTIDLDKQTVAGPDGFALSFTVDPFRRHCLLNGLDDVGLTLQHEAAITAFEERRAAAAV